MTDDGSRAETDDGSRAETDGGSQTSGSDPPTSRSDPPTSGSDPPAVDVRSVSVAYGDEAVLESVSARVDRGELVGLVGPNGSGKTTLLQTVSGALAPDDGAVLLDGDDVRALSSAAASRRVAVVPQATTLSFSFSVRQVVEMGRHPHRSRFATPDLRDRALVDRALERTRTAQFADRSVTEVSGGERQRVLLARALAQDAPTLLLDEPTASLDPHHAVETMAIVRDLVDGGRTAVAAIHDLELAARFCDRLLLLADGDVVARGPPADVLESDHVAAAFDARVAVEPEPVGGGVAVRTLAGDPDTGGGGENGSDANCRVHVLGSGQPAAASLGALGDAGAAVSLGPVPDGDRAVAIARAFDAPVVAVAPFSDVDAAAQERAQSLAAAADVVVLAAGESVGTPEPWLAVCREHDRVVAFEPGAGEVGTALRDPIRAESRSELVDVAAELEGDRSQRATAASGAVDSAPLADGGEQTDDS